MRYRIALATIGLGLAAGGLGAQTPVAKETGRMVLAELFTSEGCSSCPPADALLAHLNGVHTKAGDLIVGISEHVTYWNQLGWRDPFSTDAATERQNAYGAALHVSEVYTPQMVVNGEAQVNGSDARAVVQALESVHHPETASIHSVSAKPDGRSLAITFSLSGTLPKGKVDIYAVIAEDAASSSVARGENAGHTLAHVAVATAIVKVATTGLTPERSVRLTVPAVPAGANSKRHLILFAQMPGLGPVVATDSGGALTPPFAKARRMGHPDLWRITKRRKYRTRRASGGAKD